MAIIGVTGLPGAGKTLFGVRYLFRHRRRFPRRRIVANLPVYLPGPEVEYVDSIDDCFDLRDCLLLLDEMHLWLDARNWKRHDLRYAAWVSQLRKVNVDLLYTSQDIMSVDKLLRSRTFMTYFVESYKRLGFFTWRAVFGVKDGRGKHYMSGWYLFNPRIAECYDTDFVVRV